MTTPRISFEFFPPQTLDASFRLWETVQMLAPLKPLQEDGLVQCPPGTIKSRCARGRAKLAARLAAVRNPEADPSVLPEKQGGSGT